MVFSPSVFSNFAAYGGTDLPGWQNAGSVDGSFRVQGGLGSPNFAAFGGAFDGGMRAQGGLTYPGFRIQGGLGSIWDDVKSLIGGGSSSADVASASNSAAMDYASSASSWAFLVKQWETGMDGVPYAQAVQLRQSVADGIASGGSVTPKAQANIARWDQYTAKLKTNTAMTPAQYAASQGSGGGFISSLAKTLGINSQTPIIGGIVGGPAGGQTGAGTKSGGMSGTTMLIGLAALGGVAYLATKNKRGGIAAVASNPVKAAYKSCKRAVKHVVR